MNPQEIQVDISKADDIVCDKQDCESTYFQPVMAMKRLSPLVSPTGQEAIVPIQVYACIKCNEVPEKFKQEASNLD
jgi:hypothetical protein|tara:strand:+ start:1111 stop:1338 length:228 start_codon:yes stop_codon:yes gene_type:complete